MDLNWIPRRVYHPREFIEPIKRSLAGESVEVEWDFRQAFLVLARQIIPGLPSDRKVTLAELTVILDVLLLMED